MDLFAEALRHARQRSSSLLVQANVSALPFRPGFQLIGLFDVLEHLPEDRRVLSDLRALLAPGGKLLLTVPAHRSLWSYFDEAAHHCRRYEAAELHRKLDGAGYHVEYLTHYMTSIYPLVWGWRRLTALDRGRTKTGERDPDLARRELRIVPALNQCLQLLLGQETRFIARRWTLPIGTSLLAVCCNSP
jgi:SAM-dependent methyltransferase